jgi:hypothetical protein
VLNPGYSLLRSSRVTTVTIDTSSAMISGSEIDAGRISISYLNSIIRYASSSVYIGSISKVFSRIYLKTSLGSASISISLSVSLSAICFINPSLFVRNLYGSLANIALIVEEYLSPLNSNNLTTLAIRSFFSLEDSPVSTN